MLNLKGLFGQTLVAAAFVLVGVQAQAEVENNRRSSPALLSFEADQVEANIGESVSLSWAALNVRRCKASGDWDGSRRKEGFESLPTFNDVGTYEYTLSCWRRSARVEHTITISVSQATVGDIAQIDPMQPPEPIDPVPIDPAPVDPGIPLPEPELPEPEEPMPEQPAPEMPQSQPPKPNPTVPVQLTFSADTTSIKSGESATLRWLAIGGRECRASGAWRGRQGPEGELETAALEEDATFTLTCKGNGGTDTASVAISVDSLEAAQTVSLAWERPTKNDDGTPLEGLAAYNIYVGATRGEYELFSEINAARPTVDLELMPGRYFIAVTAVDSKGMESAYSNEVAHTVR